MINGPKSPALRLPQSNMPMQYDRVPDRANTHRNQKFSSFWPQTRGLSSDWTSLFDRNSLAKNPPNVISLNSSSTSNPALNVGYARKQVMAIPGDLLQMSYSVSEFNPLRVPRISRNSDHGEIKRTCFWTTGLPPLEPTDIVEGRRAKVHRASICPTC